MKNPAELAVMCLLGFTAILCTRPVIAHFHPSWRWTWGYIMLAVYEITDWLLDRFWTGYQREPSFLVFFSGAILASLLLTIMHKWNEEKVC